MRKLGIQKSHLASGLCDDRNLWTTLSLPFIRAPLVSAISAFFISFYTFFCQIKSIRWMMVWFCFVGFGRFFAIVWIWMWGFLFTVNVIEISIIYLISVRRKFRTGFDPEHYIFHYIFKLGRFFQGLSLSYCLASLVNEIVRMQLPVSQTLSLGFGGLYCYFTYMHFQIHNNIYKKNLKRNTID